MKKLIFVSFVSILFFNSCTTNPGTNIFAKEDQYIGFGTHKICCATTGGDCSVRKIEIIFPWDNSPFGRYVANDNISGFFKNEDWGSIFPDLKNYPNLVDAIININPKLLTLKNGSIVFVKDKSLELKDGNILYTVIAQKQVGGGADGKPCDDFVGQAQ